MHISRFAPLLSATFNIVRIWIIWAGLSFLPGAIYDAHQHPGFTPRHRTTRLDGDGVAFLALVALVVRQQLGGAAGVLAVGRVLDQTLDRYRVGLVHLVADPLAGEQALPVCGRLARRCRIRGLCFARHHALPPAALDWASTVFTRAIFFLTFAN